MSITQSYKIIFMKMISKRFAIIVFLSLTACKEAPPIKALEKVVIKGIGTEVIEKFSRNSVQELSKLGLSQEAIEFVVKNFDDDMIRSFIKTADQSKQFLVSVKKSPQMLRTWKLFSSSEFGSNIRQLRWINREL